MTRKLTLWILLVVTVGSNLAWAVAYRRLWYDAAQAEGLLDQAKNYIDALTKGRE